MPINPNDAFQSRHRIDSNSGKEQAGMMITLSQKHRLTGYIWHENMSWAGLCMSTLGKHRNMSDCTFYEAAQCLRVASVWKNRKEAGIK